MKISTASRLPYCCRTAGAALPLKVYDLHSGLHKLLFYGVSPPFLASPWHTWAQLPGRLGGGGGGRQEFATRQWLCSGLSLAAMICLLA